MVKRIRDYVKYTLTELENYTKTEKSCVKKVTDKIHLNLLPYALENIKKSILEVIASKKIGVYNSRFKGIILDIRNIKLLGDTALIPFADPNVHINILADCYIFEPQVGAIVRGIVKHISTEQIGVIIFRVFSVSIRLENHIDRSLEINSEIEFRIKKFDLQNVMPFIIGELVAKEVTIESTTETNRMDLILANDQSIRKTQNKNLADILKKPDSEESSDSDTESNEIVKCPQTLLALSQNTKQTDFDFERQSYLKSKERKIKGETEIAERVEIIEEVNKNVHLQTSLCLKPETINFVSSDESESNLNASTTLKQEISQLVENILPGDESDDIFASQYSEGSTPIQPFQQSIVKKEYCSMFNDSTSSHFQDIEVDLPSDFQKVTLQQDSSQTEISEIIKEKSKKYIEKDLDVEEANNGYHLYSTPESSNTNEPNTAKIQKVKKEKENKDNFLYNKSQDIENVKNEDESDHSMNDIDKKDVDDVSIQINSTISKVKKSKRNKSLLNSNVEVDKMFKKPTSEALEMNEKTSVSAAPRSIEKTTRKKSNNFSLRDSMLELLQKAKQKNSPVTVTNKSNENQSKRKRACSEQSQSSTISSIEENDTESTCSKRPRRKKKRLELDDMCKEIIHEAYKRKSSMTDATSSQSDDQVASVPKKKINKKNNGLNASPEKEKSGSSKTLRNKGAANSASKPKRKSRKSALADVLKDMFLKNKSENSIE